jgi:hypothetical protein
MLRPKIIASYQNFRLVTLLAISLTVLPSSVNRGLLAQAQSPELTITASFAGKQAITPLEQIDLTVNRPLAPTEGRLAIFIGLTDMTALFTSMPKDLSYTPRFFPLPAGENPLTVYLVSPNDEWKEIARFTLRVSNDQAAETTQNPTQQSGTANGGQAQTNGTKRPGVGKLGIVPSLTLGMQSQAAESHFPVTNRPDRPTYMDFSLQGTVQTDITSGTLNSQTQFDFVGTSFQREALRYGELGDHAPQFDLSSYLMQFQIGKAKIALGQVSFGTNRFLIESFSSRGITLAFPLNKHLDLSLTALNGTSVVGWNNFIGLDRRKHQVESGTVGYEFLPERPGGLRLEVNLLHGSLLPISNFNQGNVTDAEQSKGFGFRLITSDKSQRFRFDGGFARSRFNNPNDPSLNRGFGVVGVRETARNARYLQASYDILRGTSLTKTMKANLTFNYRHERVDPLFRSVAAYSQANKFQNQFELVGSIGGINAGFSNFRFNDNLDNIPSILKAFTRRNGLILGVPLVSLFGNSAKPSWWLPVVSYSFDQTHQFALSVPSNAGYKAPQIPDQISTNQSFSTEWQANKWRFGYHFNDSFQDNRSGRDGVPVDLSNSSNQGNVVHEFTFGLAAARSLDLNFNLSSENLNSKDSNPNKDKNRDDSTLRFGIGANLRTTKSSAFAVNLSNTMAHSLGDLSKTSNRRNTEFDLQWSYRFGWEKSQRKVQGQFHIRYANQYARSLDNFFGLNSLTKSQTLNAGMSFTFF